MKRRILWILPLFGLGAALAGAIWLSVPQVPNLVDRARRIPVYTSSSTLMLSETWISPTELLLPDESSARITGLTRLNIRTGAKLFRIDQMSSIASNSRSSPSGSSAVRRIGNEWRWIHELEGILGSWPSLNAVILWDRSEKAWAAVDYLFQFARVYRPGATEPDRYRLPPYVRPSRGMAAPLWFDDAGGEIGMAVGVPGGRSRVDVIRLRDSRVSKSGVFALPSGTTDVTDVKVSPTRDRIAWYLGRKSSAPDIIERILHYLGANRRRVGAGHGPPPPPMDTEGIWVSELDGRNMRAIGEVKAEWAPTGMASFTWHPDGKRILFTYRRGIYIVPVE